MKYITIFHANLNYAYLTPDRYEFVIRNAYEMIIDTMRNHFPESPYVFEASGYTLEQIAIRTPDVLEKLKTAINSGQCEFMGSPYAHPMLPNFPQEDGLWSIRFSNKVYQDILGFQPASFWNPECGWRSYVPQQLADAGYSNLIGDFEAYSRSCLPEGTPVRPEIYEKEFSKEPAFYNFGFQYDLPGTEKTIHFPFEIDAGREAEKLRLFLRTDRIAQFGVRYFMGMQGYSLDKYLALIDKYSAQNEGEPEGAVVIFADDAEYIGTNGWFRLKYQNEPDRVFEATPDSQSRLIDLMTACTQRGEFTTFNKACQNLPVLDEPVAFDDDSAWHGAKASTWAETPMARLLRPWQDLVRDKLSNDSNLTEQVKERAWYHLTNSYNSDGQWPPTLPDAPHIIHPFNYGYCFENLLTAEQLVGGVDRNKLTVDPVSILKEILGPQQKLVMRKAAEIANSSSVPEQDRARQALALLRVSSDTKSLQSKRTCILYPAEYKIRADALVEARRLVGGIEIEKI